MELTSVLSKRCERNGAHLRQISASSSEHNLWFVIPRPHQILHQRRRTEFHQAQECLMKKTQNTVRKKPNELQLVHKLEILEQPRYAPRNWAVPTVQLTVC